MAPRVPSALFLNGRPCTLNTFYCTICLPFPCLRVRGCLLPQRWGQLRRTSLSYSVARGWWCCFLLLCRFFPASCQQHSAACVLPFRPLPGISSSSCVAALLGGSFPVYVAVQHPVASVVRDRIAAALVVRPAEAKNKERQQQGGLPPCRWSPHPWGPSPCGGDCARRRRAHPQRLSAKQDRQLAVSFDD